MKKLISTFMIVTLLICCFTTPQSFDNDNRRPVLDNAVPELLIRLNTYRITEEYCTFKNVITKQ